MIVQRHLDKAGFDVNKANHNCNNVHGTDLHLGRVYTCYKCKNIRKTNWQQL